jgi:1-deoxyxylulose-5-phosphate synthase
VIAIKVHGRMHGGPNGASLSRKAIMAEVDASLSRLGTDHIDLYQIHRWDPFTPIEETLGALHDVVKAGEARYIGASSMNAWQFSKAHYLARMAGLTSFVSMQNHYSLLTGKRSGRCCRCAPIWESASSPGVHSPQGGSPRDWDEETTRSQTDEFSSNLYRPGDRAIVEQVARIASERQVPRAQVALAWVATRPGITAPIIGATKPQHISEAVAALDLV